MSGQSPARTFPHPADPGDLTDRVMDLLGSAIHDHLRDCTDEECRRCSVFTRTRQRAEAAVVVAGEHWMRHVEGGDVPIGGQMVRIPGAHDAGVFGPQGYCETCDELATWYRISVRCKVAVTANGTVTGTSPK